MLDSELQQTEPNIQRNKCKYLITCRGRGGTRGRLPNTRRRWQLNGFLLILYPRYPRTPWNSQTGTHRETNGATNNRHHHHHSHLWMRFKSPWGMILFSQLRSRLSHAHHRHLVFNAPSERWCQMMRRYGSISLWQKVLPELANMCPRVLCVCLCRSRAYGEK